MARIRDWFCMHFNWFEDPVLMVIADTEPGVMSVWPVLCAMAQAQSHHEDNPAGVIQTSVGHLARSSRVSTKRVERILELLRDGEIATVENGKLPGAVVVELVTYSKWNVPKGSDAHRAKQYRQQSAFAGKNRHNVTTPTDSVTESSRTQTLTLTKQTLLSDSPPSNRDAQVTEILEHWQTVFGKQRSAISGPKARKRTTRVRSRLAEGWTVDELKQALDGFGKSSYHLEHGHTDIPTVLRDSSQVEKGIDLANPKPRTLATVGNGANDPMEGRWL